MWNGGVDWSGRVTARIITSWHPKFMTKINGQFSGKLEESHIQAEANFKGKVSCCYTSANLSKYIFEAESWRCTTYFIDHSHSICIYVRVCVCLDLSRIRILS